MRISILLVAVGLLCASPARAQPPAPAVLLSAEVGGGRTWDDEGNLGNGVALGVRVDRRLIGQTRAEIGVDLLTHDRGPGSFQAHGRTALVTAALVQRFSQGPVRPYVLGGLALAWHTGHVRLADGPRQPRSSIDPAWVVGAGASMRLSDRVEIGPEARLFVMRIENDVNPALAFTLGVRLGLEKK